MTPKELAQAKRIERKQIVDKMNALVPATGEMTAEELSQHADYDKAQNKLAQEIAVLERNETLSAEMNARIEHKAVATGRSTDETAADDAEHRAAFRAYLKGGIAGLNDDQRRILNGMRAGLSADEQASMRAMNALSGVDLTGGAVLIPTTMGTTIESAQKAFGGMIDPGVCTQINTDMGNELVLPTDNDTSNEGEMLGENKPASEQGIAFGSVTMRGYIFSSKYIRVPVSLLEDSVFDLETYLANMIGTRLGRAKNRKFTTGTGASQPMGVFSIAPTGVTLAAGETGSITYDEIIDLKHSVDPAYRVRARFMMNDTSLKVIKKLKDGVGRPLWQSGLAFKEPDTIDGNPFTINQHSPDMAADAKSIAFGDFSKYFIRNVGKTRLLRLTERFAEYGQVAFLAFERADGQLIDAGTHPIKVALHPSA